MKIPIEWLKEYCKENYKLQIKQTPQRLADVLSMHSFETGVVDNGKCLEIEVTADRGDCLSITGIARELKAINRIIKPK